MNMQHPFPDRGVGYSVSVSENPEPSKFERHCHEYFELLYVEQGEGRYVVEGSTYPLKPHTLLLIRPYEFHFVCPEKNTPYKRHVFHFTAGALFETVLFLPMLDTRTNGGRGVYFSKERMPDLIWQILEQANEMIRLFKGASHHHAKQNAMIRADLNRILLLLSLSEPEKGDEDSENMIARVIEYLNLHLENEISLEGLAQRFFVSKYYLCHAFRQHTGVPIFNYLNAKRIAMAQTLLQKGEPATSVAYQVGFRNYSSFYRTFCKVTGHAPVYSREERERDGADDEGKALLSENAQTGGYGDE